ncbi:MAG: DUF3078 domain-containing protein [Bacteroidia bacterium]|nr:DUF3078 domain-containing protein [Bacteroidia bacterium]
MKKMIYWIIIPMIINTLSINASNDRSAGDTIKTPPVKLWKFGGTGNLSLSQGYLKNWVEGGENSMSTLSVLTGFAKYNKDKVSWENTIEIKYGTLRTGTAQSRKNEDKIELNSKMGYQAYKTLYYSFLCNFKTQGFKGYDYPTDTTKVLVSDFFAPAYLLISIGMDYKPTSFISVMLSPLTSKTTFVRDGGKMVDTVYVPGKVDETKYGLKPGKSIKKEMGAYMKSIITFNLMKSVQAVNRIDLFTDYLNNPQNIQVNWEVNLNMKINKYLATTVSTRLVYDDNINIPVPNSVPPRTKKAIQFKEVLGVGLSFLF